MHLYILLSYFTAAFFIGSSGFSGLNAVDIGFAVLSVFLIFFFVYAYNSFVDFYSGKNLKKVNMFRGFDAPHRYVYIYFFALFLVSLYLSYIISVFNMILIYIIGLVGFLYSFSWSGLKYRGPALKSLSVTFCSALTFIYFAILFSDDLFKVVVFAMYFGALTFSGTIYQDIKDRLVDGKGDLRTFATVYSDKGIALMFDAITVCVYLFFALLCAFGHVEDLYILMLFVLPLRLRFTAALRNHRYKTAGKASLYSYIFSALIIFIVWVLMNLY